MVGYKNLFLTKDQYFVDSLSDFKNNISKIVVLINKTAKIQFDWTNSDKAKFLDENQLLSIQKAVAGEAQSGLVDIFSPYIEPRLEELFGDKLNYKIRVSAQVKSLWNSDIIKKKRKGFFVDDIFYEEMILMCI